MTEYDMTVSSKGQFVLPKEVREKFKLSAGSKVKLIVDGEQIIIKPHTVADQLQDIIRADLAKEGKTVNEDTVKEYQAKIAQAVDALVVEADREYNAKQYITLAQLKKENADV
ncbi:MAG: SpoVT / AbrB like domain protein [Firmicutes bacterium]|nr:SpoVT / AbrB like domain protein [Bacillota bacterium]